MTTATDVHSPRIPAQPRRTPAMTVYCTALTHYSSCLQATALMLRNNDAFADEDLQQRELASAARLRALDEAQQRADAGREHCSRVRLTYGLLPTEATPAPDPGPDDGLGRPDESSLDAELAALAMGRHRLNAAEQALGEWTSRAARKPGDAAVVKAAAAKAAVGGLALAGAVALAKFVDVV